MIPASSAAGRDFYLAYLNSPAWRATRNRALRLADYRCQHCGNKRDLQVHHRTYERLGREWDQDLEVLCDSCHRGHHIEDAEHTVLGVYLTLARIARRDRWTGSIADLNADVKALCAQHHVPADPRSIEKALRLVVGDVPVSERRATVATPQVALSPDADPCSCEACVASGVSTQRQHRDRYSSELLHGEDLRRWYAARDAFVELAARIGHLVAKPFPGSPRTPEEHTRILNDQRREHHQQAYRAEREAHEKIHIAERLDRIFKGVQS